MKTKVLIADDHEVVRSGLKLVLESSGQFEVVAEASDGSEVTALVAQHLPDLVILDISMPTVNGLEATYALRPLYPDLKILALTIHADEEYIYRMLKAGANGYILKTAAKDEIYHAAESVISGKTFFCTLVSNVVIREFFDRAAAEGGVGAGPELAEESESPLTKRETEILRLIAEGLTNREIGEKLYISIRTVNTHRTNLMQKLKLHETAGLVRYAIKNGLLSADNSTFTGSAN
ncbi:MAG: response regulator transcription factor [Bacteroidota bacterium]